MNKVQAFSILEQALNVANTKGAFVLSDAAVIQTALTSIRVELDIPLPDTKPQGGSQANTEKVAEDVNVGDEVVNPEAENKS